MTVLDSYYAACVKLMNFWILLHSAVVHHNCITSYVWKIQDLTQEVGVTYGIVGMALCTEKPRDL